MRSTLSLRSVAKMYLLGIAWCIVMIGAAVVLMSPMTEMSVALGIADPVVSASGTIGLAIAAASAATGLLWLAASRLVAGRESVTSHA